MKRLLITLACAAALLALLVAPPLAGATGDLQPSPLTTFSTAPYGEFAAGMASDSHGNLIVSLTSWGYYDETTADPDIGEIWSVTPGGDQTLLATMDHLSAYGALMSVAIDDNDRVYVAVVDYGLPDSIGSGVFRLDNGELTRVVSLPSGSWPNGIAFHKGRLYIADSALSAIWRVRVDDGVATPTAPWFQSPLLAPSHAMSAFGIGANGVAFRGDTLYTVVSDYGRVVRVPLMSDGTAGSPSVLCKRPELRTGDGIAFDILGRLWIATNGSDATPSGGLYRVATDGTVTQIAKDPGWLNYPTTPVFGRTPASALTLYVLNGAYYSWADPTKFPPDIIPLQVGVPGLPLR
jgi:sugar lactone lactonase YvrE